jgi:hypothetical protein
MGPTLGVLVEYTLIGLAWLPSLNSLQDNDDWQQECTNLFDMHLGFDDEARKRVIDSLPEGKLKTELQAQESQTADQLSGLLAKGPGAEAFQEFDRVMKSCPQ